MSQISHSHSDHRLSPWAVPVMIILSGLGLVSVALWIREVEFSAVALQVPAIIVGCFILLAAAYSALIHLLELRIKQRTDIAEALITAKSAVERAAVAEEEYFNRMKYKREFSEHDERDAG